MCSRQGLGKVRRLDVQIMWIQQRIRQHDLDLYKVLGEENPADIMTKAGIPEDRILHLIDLMGCRFVGGRAETAPTLRREGGVKTFALEALGKAVSTAESQVPSQSGRTVSTVPSEIRSAELNDDPLCQLLLEKFALSVLGLPHEAQLGRRYKQSAESKLRTHLLKRRSRRTSW